MPQSIPTKAYGNMSKHSQTATTQTLISPNFPISISRLLPKYTTKPIVPPNQTKGIPTQMTNRETNYVYHNTQIRGG